MSPDALSYATKFFCNLSKLISLNYVLIKVSLEMFRKKMGDNITVCMFAAIKMIF